MANLNIKHLFDHYFHVKPPPYHLAAPSLFYKVGSAGCRLASHGMLLLGCIPLLTIKSLPEPLHEFPVRGFYYHQWLDDLDHIDDPLNRVTYAAARVVDACRLAIDYGVLASCLSKFKSQEYGYGCQCNGQCQKESSSITL